jgi:hypothetical protein
MPIIPNQQHAFGQTPAQQQQPFVQQQNFGMTLQQSLPQQQSQLHPVGGGGGFQTGEEDPFADLPLANDLPLAGSSGGGGDVADTVVSDGPGGETAGMEGARGGGSVAPLLSTATMTSTIAANAPAPPAMSTASPRVSSPTVVVLPPNSSAAATSSTNATMASPRSTTATTASGPPAAAASTASSRKESGGGTPTTTTAAKTLASPRASPVVVPAPASSKKSSSSPPKKTKAGDGGSAGVGIGNSGARLPPLDASAYANFNEPIGVGNARFFNMYEFLAGADRKEPRRKFYPIERVAPFWSLMGLDVYVERWQQADELGGGGNVMAGIAGSITAGISSMNLVGGGAAGDGVAASKTADGGVPPAFSAAPMYEQLAKALSFQCHIVQESERAMYAAPGRGKSHPLEYLRQNQIGLEACITLISMLPHSAGASGKALDGLFLTFINTFVNFVGNLQPNQQIVLPGGWQTPDSAHLCLYVLRNRGSTFSFSVINTGPDGLEYHLSNFDGTTGRQTKQLCLTVWDIPPERITDSTFWVLLFRLQVYPSKRNNAEFLYAKLLTSLNSRPLLSNNNPDASGPPAEFYYPPATAKVAHQYHQLALLALTTIPEWNMPSSRYSSLLVRTAAVEIAYRGIEDARPSSMDPEDSRILQLTARNLANHASTLDPAEFAMAGNRDGGSGAVAGPMMNSLGLALSNTWELLDKLLAKLSVASSRPLDQHSMPQVRGAEGGGDEQFEKGLLKSLRAVEGSAAHPFFGRLRRDNYEEVVKALMVSFCWFVLIYFADSVLYSFTLIIKL